ncbi:MBG domain-containing protein [Pararcticibacter amylolyticus]|uniref:IPT/TIG domain-containing protein n=1 Tax=Pararcticibacter amylolyticus TaxID=2173175 RepID=A0A2U2PGR9_9SPHI|nr:MBG domain-containing protein [Pararcticibacter amylolyticus]PWG80605.1 hypothetical protein DDR33_11295 [Pararcticibacter amylolyticus]
MRQVDSTRRRKAKGIVLFALLCIGTLFNSSAYAQASWADYAIDGLISKRTYSRLTPTSVQLQTYNENQTSWGAYLESNNATGIYHAVESSATRVFLSQVNGGIYYYSIQGFIPGMILTGVGWGWKSTTIGTIPGTTYIFCGWRDWKFAGRWQGISSYARVTTPVQIESITRNGSLQNSADDQVIFKVTFTGRILGLTKDNFSLVNDDKGLPNATITSVQQGSASNADESRAWYVTVATGFAKGELGIKMIKRDGMVSQSYLDRDPSISASSYDVFMYNDSFTPVKTLPDGQTVSINETFSVNRQFSFTSVKPSFGGTTGNYKTIDFEIKTDRQVNGLNKDYFPIVTTGNVVANFASATKTGSDGLTWTLRLNVVSGTGTVNIKTKNDATGITSPESNDPLIVAANSPVLTSDKYTIIDVPVITGISPLMAKPGDVLTITGSGFITGQNVVYFGGIKATDIVSQSPTEIKVTVPAGSGFAAPAVQNAPSGLIAYSPVMFSILNDRNDDGVNVFSFEQNKRAITLTGANFRSVRAADFNDDGFPDLAVTSSDQKKILIYMNNKSGVFSLSKEITLPNTGYALTTGDINADGKLDLIASTVAGADHVILVYTNTSSTSTINFNTTPVQISTGAAGSITNVAVADIDRDGRADIIAAIDLTSSVYVYRNTTPWPNAPMTFAGKAEIKSGKTGVRGLIAGDLDKDGKPEIIIGDYGSSSVVGTTVTIFKNNTTPGSITAAKLTEQNTVLTAAGSNPLGLALGDLDGDGYPDLVVESASDNLAVYLNKNGVIDNASKQVYPFAALGNGEVAIRDLNGDGKPEIIASHSANAGISIFRNNITAAGALNASSFSRSDYKTGTGAQSLAIADFNKDGKGDIAVANTTDASISIFFYKVPPVIDSFSPSVVKAGETITITGKNFNTTAENNVVYFGAVKAAVQSATSTSLVVTVPAGATYGPLTVLDVTTNLTGVSSQNFSVTNTDDQLFFSARNNYSIANVTLQNQSMIAADLDADGNPELISVSPSSNGSKIVINRNKNGSDPIKANSFAGTQLSITGSKNVYAIAAGDIDGDGKKDIVAADYDANTVRVLLNDGTSLAVQSTAYAVGGNPASVTVADIDGDGKLDVITANKKDGSISVLRNISTGAGNVAFESQLTASSGTAPVWVAAADVNADGKPEVITANSGSDNVSVFTNTTTGSVISFAAAQAYATQSSPAFVTVADLDADGIADLAVVNKASASVSVLKNSTSAGNISFAAAVNYATGTNPVAVAFGDLNADGKPEMVVANAGSNTISIFRNKAVTGSIDAGSFETKTDYATAAGPVSVLIADLNNNNKAEIAVANKDGNSVSVFQNQIPPIITAVSPLSGAPGTTVTITGKNFNKEAQNNVVFFGAVQAVVSSVSSDGTSVTVTVPQGATYRPVSLLDQATGLTAYSASAFAVTNAVTDGSFPFATTLPIAGSNLSSVSAADLNSDGHTDLVTVDPKTGKIYVESNTGGSKISTELFSLQDAGISVDPGASSLTTADIDGDGKLDLVLSNFTSSKVYTLLNTSSAGNFSFAAPQSFSTGTNPGSISVADIDGDGKADIITVGKNTNVAYVLRNISDRGAEKFEDPAAAFTVGANPSSVSVRDLNNDGKPEIVTVNAGTENAPGNTISVLENVSTPGMINSASFKAQVVYTVGDKPSRVAIADADGDGFPELAVTSAGTNTVSVLRNTSSANTLSFDPAVAFATGTSPEFVAFGDINGDSKPDMVVVNMADNTVSVFSNTADQGSITSSSFATKQDYGIGKGANSLVIADLNGDGRAELSVVNGTEGTISILKNMPVPVVTDFLPKSGPSASTVIISGKNFNVNPANNIVYFGASQAVVQSASSTSLTVQVPAGATYMPVSVLDAESGLSGFSSDKFVLTNPGVADPELKISSFNAPVNVPTQNQPSVVAMSDLDADGKTDMVVVNTQSNSVTVYHNESADGSITSTSFPAAKSVTLAVGDAPKSIVVGDVDGDGKPDVVVSNYASRTFSVLRNTSASGSLSFESQVSVNTASGSNMITMNDMNGDGKPDVITANAGSSTVSVFRNISTASKVAFDAAKTDYAVGGTPWWVTTGDLNGDGKPEVVTANAGSNNISVITNTAGRGVFNSSSFAPAVNYAAAEGSRSVAIGDLDADGKAELVAANNKSNTVSVFHNTTSGTTASFASPENFATGDTPYGVSIGDVNGDGKPDVVTGNLQSVSVLRNITEPGTINSSSFASKVDIKTLSSPQVVAIGDLDRNAAAELVIANEYSNNLSVISTKITAKITFEAIANKIYGDTDFDAGATSNNTATPIVYTSSNKEVATVTADGKIHITGAGFTDIKASQAPSGAFANASEVTQRLTVEKATLTVNAVAVNKVYGHENPKYDYTYTNFVNGETDEVLETKPVLKAVLDVTTKTPVEKMTKTGTYPVILSNELSDNNYTFNYNGADLIINKAKLTAKARNKSIALGDAIPAFDIDYSGFAGTDTKENAITAEPVASLDPNADVNTKGDYAITLTGGIAENYDFILVNGSLSVGKANPVFTVEEWPEEKTYGDASFRIKVSSTNEELPLNYSSSDESVASVNPISGEVTIKTAGTTVIRVSQEPSDNYAGLEDQYKTLTVKKATLQVTIKDAEKNYGKANPSYKVSYSGFKNGETASVINVPAIALAYEGPGVEVSKRTPVNNGNPYNIDIAAQNQAFDDNYDFDYSAGPGKLIIHPAPLTATATSYTRAYGESNPALQVTYDGFVNDEVELSPGVFTTPATVSTTASGNSPVGVYPITVNGAIAPNYVITSVAGELTIEKAKVTVSVASKSGSKDMVRTYGENNPEFEITYSGFKNGETAAVLSQPATVPASINNRTSAGIYPVVASGAQAANYMFDYLDDAMLTINKKDLSVKAKDASRKYGADNPVFELEYNGFVTGDSEADIDTKPVGTSADRFAAVASGPYVINVSGGSDNNYKFIYTNSGHLTVVKAPLMLVAENKQRLYGVANPALTVQYRDFVNGETAATVFGSELPELTTTAQTDSPGSDANGNVIRYPITFSKVPAASNYEITTQPGTLIIGKATLTIAIKNVTRKYGQQNPAFEFIYDGFTDNDNESVLSVAPVAVTTATDKSAVGKYAITFSVDAKSDNYTIVQQGGTLEVVKAPLTLIALPKTKTYGAVNPPLDFKYFGLVAGDNITTALTKQPVLATLAEQYSPVTAEGYDIFFSENAESANYEIIGPYSDKLTITPATPSISFPEIASKTYGDNDFSVGAQTDNTEAALTYSSSNEAVATVDMYGTVHIVAAGEAVIKVSQAATANYAAGEKTQNLQVAKAVLTAKALDASRVYGDENPAFTIEYSGYVNGDEAKTGVITTPPAVSTTATKISPVGDYLITVGDQGVAKNYTIVPVQSGKLKISAAELTITVDNKTRVYGDENPELTLTYSGFKNDDSVNKPGVFTELPVTTTTALKSSPVGEYPIQTTTGVAPNYFIPSVDDGKLSITKATLTARAEDKSKVYGDANPVLTIKYSGFRNNDDENTPDLFTKAPEASTTVNEQSPVNTYVINVSADAQSANYEVVTETGILKVTPAELTVTANDAEKVYGTVNPPLTVSYSGFKNGEDENVAGVLTKATAVTSATVKSATGTYDINPVGAVAGNYTIKNVKGTLTIKRAVLTAKADQQSRVYGEENPLLTIGYTGFVNGDTKADIDKLPTATTLADRSSGVGQYDILVNADGLDNNYEIMPEGNKLIITKAMLIAKADNKSRDYGVENPKLTVTYTGFVNDDNESMIDVRPVLSTNATVASPKGDYDITVANASDNNYDFNYVKGVLSVGKLEAVITAGEMPSGLIYGAADFTIPASSNNSSSPVQFNSSNTAVARVDENGKVHIVGAGTTVVRIFQPASGSYGASEDVYRTLTVGKAPLSITVNNAVRNYGEDNPDFTVVYDGFVNGENETALSAQAKATTTAAKNSPIGSYPIMVSGAASANYEISYGANGVLTIGIVSAKISIAQLPQKTYGDADFKAAVTTNNPESTVNYVSSNPGVATVDADGTIHIKGAGSTVITVSQDASANFSQGVNASSTLTVAQKSLKVVAENKSKKQGEDNPLLTYRYEGLVNGDNETAVNAGTIVTSATKTSAVGPYSITVANFSAANYVISHQPGVLIVNPAASVITFNSIEYKKYGDADFTLNATTTSDGKISYSIINANTTNPAATVDPSTGRVHILNAGNATITATVTGSSGYSTSQDVTQQLTVLKATPVITFAEIGSKTYGDADFSANASSTSAESMLTYTSTAVSVASVNAGGTIKINSGGFTNITVAQPSSLNYEAAVPVSRTLEVARNIPAIVLQPMTAKVFGDAPFTPVVTGATGTVTLTSSNSKVAVIADGQVYIIGVGFAKITATQAENGNSVAVSDAKYLEVLPATPGVSLGDLAAKMYGDADYDVTALSSNTAAPLNYSSSNVAVATISNGRIHITGAGKTKITVSQAASGNYGPASAEKELVVKPATITVTAEDKIKIEGELNPELTVTYSGFVNNESESVLNVQPVATNSADQTTAPGIYPIAASGGEDDNYTFVYKPGKLTILQIARLTLNTLPVKTYGDADFKVAATSNNSNIPVVYKGDNPQVATVDQYGNVHIVGNGTVTITASQGGDLVFTPAESVTQVLTVKKAILTVTADSKVAVVGTFPQFTVSYSGFVYNETTAVLLTQAKASVATNGLIAGTYPITASGASAKNYDMNYVEGTLMLATDGLTFLFDPMPEKTYGDADFNPGAYTNTGASIYYTSLNTQVAVIVDNKVKIVGAGHAEIVATVPGLDPAKNLVHKQTLTVKKAPQTITFQPIPVLERGAEAYRLIATSSSGLPVQFAGTNSFVGKLDGDLLTPGSIGNAKIIASQAGNENYLPAADVTLSFEVVDPAGNKIRFPKVLTPNGDGINDQFYIEGISNYPENRLVIVNRNGTKIYEARNYNNGDVSFNGKEFFAGGATARREMSPEGTYFYILEYKTADGSMKKLTGYFVLKYTANP